MSVSGQLDAARKSRSQVMHELMGSTSSASTYKPRRNQFGIGADSRPRPDISKAEFALLTIGDVFGLGMAKGPDFIALKALARQVLQRLILIVRAGFPDFGQQFHHGILGYASHLDCGSNGIAFHKSGNNLHSLGNRQRIHNDHYA